jgi:iron complex outermembrane receptor protein
MNAKHSVLAAATIAALLTTTLHAAPEPKADPAPEARAEAEARELETISVIGEGETRQVQKLDIEDLRRLPAGTSPLRVMSKLPGVSFQSADPFGAYEWSTRISIRGFNQNQLGFTLDGIPLGDMSYGNHNGLHISRALISENLDRIELAQGAGAIDTASTSNIGGTAQFFSRDPGTEYSARVAQTLGSDRAQRTYVSVDSGEHRGFKMYLSGVYADTDKWKGEGPQRQWQFNGKAVYDWQDWRFTGWAATSRREEVDYADLSLESQRRLGFDWDNFQPDWARAILAARGQFAAAGVRTLDDAYYTARGLRDDDIASFNVDWQASDALFLQALSYYHRNEGQGHWATPYRASSAAIPISLRTTEYDIERLGVIPSLTWNLGMHTVRAGLWLEDNTHGLQRNFYNLNSPPDGIFFYRDPDLRVFRQRFEIDTMQYYLTDRINLMDGALALDVGFKGTDVDIESTNIIGSRSAGELEAKDNFMPQVGARWKLTGTEEVFGSYTENLAAFRAGVSGPFSASQSAFNLFADDLEPETSDTFEIGVRTSREWFQASLALYAVDFQNRLLTIARCAGIVGCPASFANVGDVESRGAEATLVLQPWEGISWFNSYSYNDSEYQSNYLDGETLVRAEGKRVVDTPENMFSTELSWQSGPFSAYIGAKYTDERFITYLNDSSVEDYWVADAGATWQVGELGPLQELRLSVNVTNLFDEEYFATVGSNGFVTSDPNGENYTLLAGAPRQWFFTVDARF